MKTLLLLLLVALQATPSQREAALAEYLLGPQDVVSVTVVGEPEFSKKFTIASDGTFDFPQIGRVDARGLTLRALESVIGRRLVAQKIFVAVPQITIEVDEFRSQKVTVQGEVAAPGEFPLTGTTTIVDLLSQAKILPSAGDTILVNRSRTATGAAQPVTASGLDAETIRIPKADVFSGRAARMITLRNGDTIEVPKAVRIFVEGEVKNPGSFTMEGQLTIRQAIALAGGATDRAAVGRTNIVRLVDGKEKKIRVKLSELVQPGDTVSVPKKWF